jgi:hypothetical protein
VLAEAFLQGYEQGVGRRLTALDLRAISVIEGAVLLRAGSGGRCDAASERGPSATAASHVMPAAERGGRGDLSFGPKTGTLAS